jgi:hypothetical protein
MQVGIDWQGVALKGEKYQADYLQKKQQGKQKQSNGSQKQEA